MKKKPFLRIAIYDIIILISLLLINSCGIIHDTDYLEPTNPSLTIIEDLPQATETPKLNYDNTLESTNTPFDSIKEPFRTQYFMAIDLEYDAHVLTAIEKIVYQNKTENELITIPLIFPPARDPETANIKNMSPSIISSLESNNLNVERFDINLQEPLYPGDEIAFDLEFTLELPDEKGPLGYSNLQTNLYNWYPFIPPYIKGRGWLINTYSPNGEYIVNEKSDFLVKLRVTGENSIIVAASGEETVQEDRTVYTHLNARDFSLSLSPNYQVITQQIGSIQISGYIFPEDREAGNELVKNTMAALIFFQKLFDKPYPYSTLKIVEADFIDGMESDGLYYLSKDYISAYDGTHRNYMTILSAHETAHQWFYGIVGNDQANDPWLDESLCTLSEILYFEEFFPADVDWWWDYRVNSYNPEGSVDMTIYQATSWREYINAVYLNGVRFLSDFRKDMGAEFFLTALRNYILKNTDKIAFSEDFFLQFEPYDLSVLKANYFSR